jgi:hypothetical protein
MDLDRRTSSAILRRIPGLVCPAQIFLDSQPPVFRPHASRLFPSPQEVPQVVRQGKQLQPHLVVSEVVATQPRPLDRILALLDPLLRRPTSIVEPHHASGSASEVGDDEADAREQFALMPLDLGHHAVGQC